MPCVIRSMKNRFVQQFIHSAFILIIIQSLSGCFTLIGGLVVGPNWENEVHPRHDVRIEEGSPVFLHAIDGTVHDLFFVDSILEPISSYETRYLRWHRQQEEDINLPAVGDSVRISFHSDVPIAGLFTGFDPETIYLGYDNLQRIPLEELDALSTQHSEEYDGDSLRELVRTGNIPFRTIIVMTDVEGTEQKVHAEEIDRLEVRSKYIEESTSGRKGALIGLGIDGVTVLGMIALVKCCFSIY